MSRGRTNMAGPTKTRMPNEFRDLDVHAVLLTLAAIVSKRRGKQRKRKAANHRSINTSTDLALSDANFFVHFAFFPQHASLLKQWPTIR